jgi:hypothetical protein
MKTNKTVILALAVLGTASFAGALGLGSSTTLNAVIGVDGNSSNTNMQTSFDATSTNATNATMTSTSSGYSKTNDDFTDNTTLRTEIKSYILDKLNMDSGASTSASGTIRTKSRNVLSYLTTKIDHLLKKIQVKMSTESKVEANG